MMVLASVYLSVSASLPSTSDIKPVEVWLLFNLGYPILVITSNIVQQVVAQYKDMYLDKDLISGPGEVFGRQSEHFPPDD